MKFLMKEIKVSDFNEASRIEHQFEQMADVTVHWQFLKDGYLLKVYEDVDSEYDHISF